MLDTRPTAVELFCGPGGMAKGFEDADFHVLFALDIDKNSVRTYRKNHPDTHAERQDIRDTSPQYIRSAVESRFGEGTLDDLDVIIGGPPCEGFSLAGDRDPDDPRNELFRHYLKIVDALQPKAFVMENVNGILTMEDGQVKDDIFTVIREELGYHINDVWQLKAEEFGVPQKRRRVFFVAGRDELVPELKPPENPEIVTVREAIGELPPLKNGDEKTSYWHSPRTNYQEAMRENVEKNELTLHSSSKHRESTRMRYKHTPRGRGPSEIPDEYSEYKPNKQYDQRNRKVHPDEAAFTVTSHCLDEMVHYSRTQHRALSVREAARLQSFPDDYVFCGPRSNGHGSEPESTYEQVGNSVPPLLAKAIANHLKNEFLRVDQDD